MNSLDLTSTDRQISLKFTQPFNQILTMLILVGLVCVGTYLVYPAISPIFLASPYLNGFIVIVFLFGLVSCFWQVLTMINSVNWIEGFALDRPGHNFVKAPSLLATLAAMLSERASRFALTSTSTRSILDSVATRLDEGRELTRYIINLLIFLGLLGTFYGLATTIPAVVDTIRSLAPSSDGDTSMNIFDSLMTGLEAQLGGMGTAFGSSLLGLAGSLIVGLLDLFSGRAQNRFFRELEEWMSSITKLGGTGEAGDSVINAGLFESASVQMEGLQTILAQTASRMDQMSNAVERLVENSLQTQTQAAASMNEIAVGQSHIVDAIARMQSEGEGILDAETRMRLRSMDTHLSRILEDTSAGRAQGLSEIRSDLSVLSKAIAALAKG